MSRHRIGVSQSSFHAGCRSVEFPVVVADTIMDSFRSNRLTFDGQPRRMSEPASRAGRAVLLLHNLLNFLHISFRSHPAVFQIREIRPAVLAFLAIIKSDRAPERLDISQHLRPQ